MIWFSSDWHFGHKNIIKYCERPFANTQQMDNAIYSNMTSRIQKGDTLFYLGDLQWYKNTRGLDLFKYLKEKGVQVFYIRGNHDKKLSDGKLLQYVTWVGDYYELSVGHGNGVKIIMFHYPIHDWHRKEKGTWHVYGHKHTRVRPAWEQGYIYDVGVDRNLFFPVSYDRLKSIMNMRKQLEG